MNNFCIDTHCHLDFPEFEADREQVIERVVNSQVKYIINIGSSLKGSEKSVELAKKYPNIYASVGIHPHDAQKVNKNDLEEIKKLADGEKVVAIGEIGLDF